MKNVLLFTLVGFSASALSASFPITKTVTVTKLEVWPSNTGQGKYAAWVKEPLSETECPYVNAFQIKHGPAEDAAYSTLLAAVMAGKSIEIYITECGYMPLADRIRLIP
jgi:hypothetical protein